MTHVRTSTLISLACFGFLTVAVVACTKEEVTNDAGDMATSGDMVTRSCCGKPGDPGNSLGVGKYCTSAAGVECRTNTSATVCSQLLQDPSRPTYFCTQQCAPDAGTNTCGDGAKCTMDKGTQQWGCVPTPCVDTPAPGCML